MKKTIAVGVLLIVIGVSYFIFRKDEVLAPVVEEPKGVELCFAKFTEPDENGIYDKYTMRLLLKGDGGTEATGELNLIPGEKDTKIGKFEGVAGPVDPNIMARTADLWWDTFAEGMNIKEELKLIFGEGIASIAFGEMVDRGDGVYVYRDSENLNYSLELSDVACSSLTERANVEKYLKDNIITLSPVEAVLGGTWYVNSIVLNLAEKTGTVKYEDGHIQENKVFSYTVNENFEIETLTII